MTGTGWDGMGWEPGRTGLAGGPNAIPSHSLVLAAGNYAVELVNDSLYDWNVKLLK